MSEDPEPPANDSNEFIQAIRSEEYSDEEEEIL
jgi:hypothetical protein